MTGARYAYAAVAALSMGITYAQEDCQKFVEETMVRAGGKMPNYAGSNDMFRNACSEVHPLKGVPPLGALLFIVAHDGGEPPQYRDNLGNASHVGIATGNPEVVHSSATRGGVAESTLKNGWTHYGLIKGLAYNGDPEPAPDPTPNDPTQAVVLISVRLRKSLDTTSNKNVIRALSAGEKLTVLDRAVKDDELWGKFSMTVGGIHHQGWALAEKEGTTYISFPDGAIPIETTPEPPPGNSAALAQLNRAVAELEKLRKLL